jgi:hypothetical protein
VHGLRPVLTQRLKVLSDCLTQRGRQVQLNTEQLALVNLGYVTGPPAAPFDDGLPSASPVRSFASVEPPMRLALPSTLICPSLQHSREYIHYFEF